MCPILRLLLLGNKERTSIDSMDINGLPVQQTVK